jgi:hypothetical protein
MAPSTSDCFEIYTKLFGTEPGAATVQALRMLRGERGQGPHARDTVGGHFPG